MSSVKLQKALSLVLSLHGIQDPGNLGAILRSAAAVEADMVLLDKDCADPWSVKGVRASSGALWLGPVERPEDMETRLRGLQKMGLSLAAASTQTGVSYWDHSFLEPCCLMMGSEGQGLPTSILKMADNHVNIPYTGKIESLNASVSAGILLFEVLRQRKG